jgi:CubicO group peptidase (beta-lactamase class C family)
VLPELADPLVVTGYDEGGLPSTTVPAKEKITFGQLLNHSSGLDYFLDGVSISQSAPVVFEATALIYGSTGLMKAYSHSYKDEDVSAFFKILKVRNAICSFLIIY